MKLCYNQDQLYRAAEFVWNNNEAAKRWPGCESLVGVAQHILNTATITASQNIERLRNGEEAAWSSYVGTGGYLILLSTEDDETVDLDIMVDPATGQKPAQYVTVEVD